MSHTEVIRRQPAPALQAWALDFPQSGAEPRVTERGLYLQGWVLTQPGVTRGELVVRDNAGDSTLPFNNARPDVIQRVLGLAPEGHPQLRCGFIAYLKSVPASFTLGIKTDGDIAWLCDVKIDGAIAPVVAPRPTQVIVGADGWLYLDNDTNRSVDQFTGRLLLDAEGIGRWSAYLDSCVRIAADTQARHAVLIAASKEQVLAEHYPHTKSMQTVHEQVLALGRPEHAIVDSAALLRERADKASCFIKTDTHWTDRGAMHAALALLARLGLDIGVAHGRWADDVYYTMQFAGDLGVKLQPALCAPTEFLRAPPAQQGAAFDNQLANIGRVLVFDTVDAPWSETLLLFGASSSYPMLKYLKRLFRRIVFVHSAGHVDIDIVRHERPDFLVMQTTARFMIEPPTTAFDLADAVQMKRAEADTKQGTAPARGALADSRNSLYQRMLET